MVKPTLQKVTHANDLDNSNDPIRLQRWCRWYAAFVMHVRNHTMHAILDMQSHTHMGLSHMPHTAIWEAACIRIWGGGSLLATPKQEWPVTAIVTHRFSIAICDRIWGNVHSSHIQFCAFKSS